MTQQSNGRLLAEDWRMSRVSGKFGRLIFLALTGVGWTNLTPAQ